MPVSSKHPPVVTFAIGDFSEPVTASFTLYSLRDAMTDKSLTEIRAVELLKRQIALLRSIRSELGRKAQSFEELCRSQAQVTHLVPVTRTVTFDNKMRPSVKTLQSTPAENRAAQGTFKPQSLVKPHNRSQGEQSYESSRSMTATTIWNNVNKFFAVTPTVDRYRQILSPAEPPETAIQLGPHYSVSINQKLKQKFRNGNVQLRLPQELVESPEQMEISPTVVFHRLLSSFVCCDEGRYQPRSTQKVVMNLSVPVFSPNQFPVNHPGTAPYSLIPFEQKLVNEVKALGLTPDGNGPKLTDNEVMNEIMEKSKELGELMKETNTLRKEMMEELEKKEKKLIERAEMAKKWATMPVKQEQSQKKDPKRTNKRDKLG